ncbi:MAG: GtrA family protein [Dokdonella sp.]
MSLLRQGQHFILIGIVQWLVDWGVMVAASHFGLPVAAANISGRVCGALLGFWLNGSITFARDRKGPRWRQFARYVLMWCANTTVSTLAVSAINAAFGLRGAWVGKPLVDGVLALGSFLASRQWVYR